MKIEFRVTDMQSETDRQTDRHMSDYITLLNATLARNALRLIQSPC